ncbi:MAG TPA: CDP-diacylglycerol--glycerol-3-phosphate 3-phosphatidyltransferase [Alphaproteobacteria bacterium]|nr:CDP-diacylglycerol--glycerol-3-phosphate 3-phosphatidyltransferase [Alphaproteobacteria bacterium]
MILNLPNVLTLSRVAVIPVFVGAFFLEGALANWVALGLFVAAGATDFFDGFFARRRAQSSDFGRFLDPIADKLLVATALLMLAGFGRIAGVALIAAAIILLREIVISGLREYLGGLNVEVPVSRLAKWKTTVQMVAIGVLIVGTAGPPDVPIVLIGEVLLWAAALLTVVTGYDYLRAGMRHILGRDDEAQAGGAAE